MVNDGGSSRVLKMQMNNFEIRRFPRALAVIALTLARQVGRSPERQYTTSAWYNRSSKRLAYKWGKLHGVVKDGGVSPPKIRAADGNILILI